MKIFSPYNADPIPTLLEIEVATFFQLPSFQIIGLPAPEVAEARDRIRSAMETSGFEFPRKRVVLNLSPASVRKQGTGLDLAMALAVVGLQKSDSPERWGAWGELGLEGRVKSTGQVMRAIYAAMDGNLNVLFLSRKDELEARQVYWRLTEQLQRFSPDLQLVFVDHFKEAATTMMNGIGVHPSKKNMSPMQRDSPSLDNPKLMPLAPIVERWVGVAAAGFHHLLLLGSQGTGKSHAMDWLGAVFPDPPASEVLIRDLLLELIASKKTISNYRRVGVQVRPAALSGSVGRFGLKPGEFSLAHGGILIGDEFLEWASDSRELLREPLETGKLTLNRVGTSISLPANFLFAGTGNVCPCGGLPTWMSLKSDLHLPCRCTDSARRNYLGRLSGPILDRIDLIGWMGSIKDQKNSRTKDVQTLQVKVKEVQARLIHKWGKPPGKLLGVELESILKKYPQYQQPLEQLENSSLRARHKLFRLALTLAAWDGLDLPESAHLIEAKSYRVQSIFQSSREI